MVCAPFPSTTSVLLSLAAGYFKTGTSRVRSNEGEPRRSTTWFYIFKWFCKYLHSILNVPPSPHSLKRLLSGPFQNKFADLCGKPSTGCCPHSPHLDQTSEHIKHPLRHWLKCRCLGPNSLLFCFCGSGVEPGIRVRTNTPWHIPRWFSCRCSKVHPLSNSILPVETTSSS